MARDASRAPGLTALIASAGGLGYLPWAPGTLASIAAFGAWWLWRPAPSADWVATALLAVVGIWAAESECRRSRAPDPQTVVIDEVAGLWLALAGQPRLLWTGLAGLVLFRLLDIFKPPPIRQAESLHGGFGVMLDDLVAGGIVQVILYAVMHIVTT